MTTGRGYWYLAAYPKSGNTWCRIFIAELLRLSRDITDKEFDLEKHLADTSIVSSRLLLDDQLGINSCDLSFAELDPLRNTIGSSPSLLAEEGQFFKVHDSYYSPDSKGRPVVNPEGCNGVVYILRHPEDIAVSMSHFYGRSLDRCISFLLNQEAALSQDPFSGSFQVRQHLGRWDQHVRSWVDQQEIPKLIVRYEDMLSNSIETFYAIARFLKLHSKMNLVEQTVANISISRLQRLEKKAGGFSENVTGSSRFFRSGRSGEGAARLNLEQRRQLSEVFADVMSRFGYRGIE